MQATLSNPPTRASSARMAALRIGAERRESTGKNMLQPNLAIVWPQRGDMVRGAFFRSNHAPFDLV